MKNYILLLAIIIVPFFSQAQNASIQQFFEKYSEMEEATDLSLDANFLKMVSSGAKDQESEMIKKISKFRLLQLGEKQKVERADIKSLLIGVKKSNFEDLIKVRDGKTKVDIMICEAKGLVTNVLLLVDEPDNFVLISLEGMFKLSDFQNWDLDIDGTEHLKNIGKEDRP